VLLEPLANNFGFSDIRTGRIGQWVATNEDIDARLVEFLAHQEFIKFLTGRSNRLTGPVRKSQLYGGSLRLREEERA